MKNKLNKNWPKKNPWLTKKEFEKVKGALERSGYEVKTKYRKNMKAIKLGDIILNEK